MRILVDRLTETPVVFDFEAGTGWWQQVVPSDHALPSELPEPAHLHVRAHAMAQDLFLDGALRGSVDLECSRCLARYRHRLDEPFQLVLEPAGSRLPSDPEGAEALARDGLALGDDLDAGWFRGDEIDLSTLAAELVSLALPVQPLCREDCPGLCSRCGADLSRSSCRCEEKRAESPFAVLASLREGQTGGRS